MGGVESLALEELASSGLTEEDATRLKISWVSNAKELDSSFNAAPALVIPYFDPYTGGAMTAHPSWPPFFRIRYLGVSAELEKPEKKKGGLRKKQRYSQPPDSGICAYFPLGVDWPSVLSDPTTSIIITEGEKKAASACKLGIPTIGLGGVWNWRSADQGIEFLASLEKICWVKRSSYLIFDSDVASNPNVCAALNAFAESLYLRGAVPYVILLPAAVDKKKVGLDDYLLDHSPEELKNLIVQTRQHLTLSRALFALNERVVYIRRPGVIADTRSNELISVGAFREHSFKNVKCPKCTLNPNGDVNLELVPIPDSWLSWPLRRDVARMVYTPGDAQFVENGDEVLYNIWPGWGCDSYEGPGYQVLLDLLHQICSESEEGVYEYFLCWIAYMFQQPGVKMFVYVMLFSPIQGSGKTFLGEIIGSLMGDNYCSVLQRHLESDFNSWMLHRQFVVGDELTGNDQRRYANKIKTLVTQEEMHINAKGVQEYTMADCINYMFTSNGVDAVFLENNDRRAFVVEGAPGGGLNGKLSDSLVARLTEFKRSPEMAAHARYYLTHCVDLSKFNPRDNAMVTNAKRRMIAHGRSSLGDWLSDLKESPYTTLVLDDAKMQERDIYSVAEIYEVYAAQHGSNAKLTKPGMGKALSQEGFIAVHDGREIRIPGKGAARYYAVRHPEKWRAASHLDVIKYLLKFYK